MKKLLLFFSLCLSANLIIAKNTFNSSKDFKEAISLSKGFEQDSISLDNSNFEKIFNATELKNYSGDYVLKNNPNCVCTISYGIQMPGIINYQYKEINEKRIFHGTFQFKAIDKNENYMNSGRFPFQQFNVTGLYDKGMRNGKWSFSFILNTNSSNEKTIINGTYKNGKMDGVWEYSDLFKLKSKKWKVNYSNGKLSGNFVYELAGVKVPEKLTGSFDEDGFLNGEWVANTINEDNSACTITFNYHHGILISYKSVDHSTGETKSEIFDKKSISKQAIWIDNKCEIDGETYSRDFFQHNEDVLSYDQKYYFYYIFNRIRGWGSNLFPALVVGTGFDDAPRFNYFLNIKDENSTNKFLPVF